MRPICTAGSLLGRCHTCAKSMFASRSRPSYAHEKNKKPKKKHCQPVLKQIRSSASSSNSVTFDLWRSRSNNQEQRCVNGCRTSNGLQTSKLSSVFVQLPGISSLKQETLDDPDDVIITSSFYIFTSITLLADKRPQRST